MASQKTVIRHTQEDMKAIGPDVAAQPTSSHIEVIASGVRAEWTYGPARPTRTFEQMEGRGRTPCTDAPPPAA